MELYGKILLFAMPAFLFLVLLEKGYGVLVQKDTFRNMDMVSSLSSGITNVVKDVLGLSISILSYTWLVEHIAVFKIENTPIVYLIAFIVLDFQGYWVHRWAHEVNIFWNKHAIHHSSEDYNLACALRQSISSFINLFTFFLIPAAILGVPKEVITIVAPIQLFAQFWYHTQHIDKMGFLEKIIVTPSHHRVHHAINPEYMDKNYAQIFIVFDKWFGTFQEELPSVPPVYGITRPAATWNPIKINFQHLWLLFIDAWRAEDWRDKFRIWVMPTGWRPSDVAARFPIKKIEDPYHFDKYETKASTALHVWIWVQFFAVIALVFYFFGNLGRIGSPNIFFYGGFIYLAIYSYTELMDRNRFALAWEMAKNALGFGIIVAMGDWFGASELFPSAKYIVGGYFILSTLVTTYFVLAEFKNDHNPTTEGYHSIA